jgi:hypothetical protein
MLKIFTIFLVIIGLSGDLYSQSSAPANCTATIVEPATLTKSIDKIYGDEVLIISTKVTMSPVTKGSKTDNIALPVSSGIITVASFHLSGPGGYSYTFSLQPEPLTLKVGSKDMQVVSSSCESNFNTGNDGLIAGVFVSVSPNNVTVNYN